MLLYASSKNVYQLRPLIHAAKLLLDLKKTKKKKTCLMLHLRFMLCRFLPSSLYLWVPIVLWIPPRRITLLKLSPLAIFPWWMFMRMTWSTYFCTYMSSLYIHSSTKSHAHTPPADKWTDISKGDSWLVYFQQADLSGFKINAVAW